MPVLETPSRIWRRIEQNEANNDELPSLPSVSELDEPLSRSVDRDDLPPPIQSTPTGQDYAAPGGSMHRRQTSSQTRFANSLLKASRSTRGTQIVTDDDDDDDSFDISRISYAGNDYANDVEVSLAGHSFKNMSFGAKEPSMASRHTPNGSYGVTNGSFAASKSPASGPPVSEQSRSIHSDRKPATWATPSDESIRRTPSPASTPSLSRSIASSSSSSLRSNGSLHAQDRSTPSRRPNQRQVLSPPQIPLPEDDAPEEEEDITTLHEPAGHTAQTPSPRTNDTSARSPPLDATPRPQNTNFRDAAATLATPSMRRRDFLMALVDSNARPRLAQPTPHPTRQPFVTPARPPHPLSQVYTAGNSSAESGNLSTASSHDLTVHRRANASFDPAATRNAAAAAAGGAGLARFDTVKLNTYLHALNKRLTEENRILNERLGETGRSISLDRSRSLLERIEQERDPDQMASESFINAMMEDLAAVEREKERASNELEEERRLRARDGEVYKERLAGVEAGVEKIVQELEDRLEVAEQDAKAAQRVQKAVEAEREAERARADRAERRLAMQSQDHGADAAEMAAAQDRIAELTHELTSVKNELKNAEDDRDAARRDTEATKVQVRALERKVCDAQDEGLGKDQDLRISKTLAIELQQTVSTLQAEAERLRDEVEIDKQHIKDLEHDYTTAFQEAERLKMQMETMRAAAVQSEAALEEAERQMTDDADTIAQLRAQVADLQHSVHESSLASRRGVDASAGRSTILPDGSVYAEEVEALRADLDAAHAEIGRLKYMYGQTPVRSAITKAKDARLDELERRNEQLEEELVELQRFVAGADALSKANISIGKPETPLAFKQTMHRINSLVRTPKTPGAPLRDPSWAATTPGKTGQDSLLANIAQIQRQLNRAEADLGAVNAEEEDRWGLVHLSAAELRRRLTEAKTHIAALQEELLALRRKAEAAEASPPPCNKCAEREDVGNETVQAVSHNRAANSRQRQPLRPANLNIPKESDAELQKMKKEQAAAQARIETELAKARNAVASLEAELEAERNRLAKLAAEQERATDERDNAVRQLRRTKEGMEDVKNQLNQIKQENQTLEAQVQRNAERGQRLASLENKLAENQRTIEHLRADREKLLTEHDQMHQRYKATTDRLQQLRQDHSDAIATQDNRQHQLEMQAREIETLKAELSRQTSRMQLAQDKHERMNADRDEQLADLAHDLKRVQQEAHTFGRELGLLIQEKENLELKRRRSAGELQRKDDLEQEINELKLRHNKECKGLFLQIQYLKAKFTRENLMRDNLSYQKGYLLILLSRFERRENRIVASIARIGFPHQQQQQTQKANPRRTLRGGISAVIFTLRAKKAAASWNKECAPRQAIQDALEQVRRRRVGAADS